MRQRVTRIWMIGVLALIASAGTADADQPADALVPENDRIAQLELRIAMLEARLAAAEQKTAPTRVAPAMHRTTASSLPPSEVSPRPLPSPLVPAQNLPQPTEQEINGVKFRLYLLDNEQRTAGQAEALPTREWRLLMHSKQPNPSPWLFPEPGDYPPLRYDPRLIDTPPWHR